MFLSLFIRYTKYKERGSALVGVGVDCDPGEKESIVSFKKIHTIWYTVPVYIFRFSITSSEGFFPSASSFLGGCLLFVSTDIFSA